MAEFGAAGAEMDFFSASADGGFRTALTFGKIGIAGIAVRHC